MAAAYPDQGAGNDPEPLGLALHHHGPTFISSVSKGGYVFGSIGLSDS